MNNYDSFAAALREQPELQADTMSRLAADVVRAAAPRIAELGEWPAWVDPSTLVERIPVGDSDGLGGFDAGVACALDMIPRDRQELAARHHAAYTPDSVAWARRETTPLDDPDSQTCWWLAACHVCDEGPVNAQRFVEQLREFDELAGNPAARLAAARAALEDMTSAFEVTDGVAYAVRDGGAQGAYLAGYDLSVTRSDAYGLWFIGTFRRTLGLESFTWSDPGDPETGTPGRSGPVAGSAQFVKAADVAELEAVLAHCTVSD